MVFSEAKAFPDMALERFLYMRERGEYHERTGKYF